jgi:hypothetical protein
LIAAETYGDNTMTHLSKRINAMRAAAQRYQATFGSPLAARLEELIAAYPNVESPNWVSWEGHKFTNAATTSALRRWLSAITL